MTTLPVYRTQFTPGTDGTDGTWHVVDADGNRASRDLHTGDQARLEADRLRHAAQIHAQQFASMIEVATTLIAQIGGGTLNPAQMRQKVEFLGDTVDELKNLTRGDDDSAPASTGGV